MHITEPAADTDAMLPERQRRQVLAALPLLGTALLLAGCGSTPRSSKQAQRRPAPADGQLRTRYPQLAARQPLLLDSQLREAAVARAMLVVNTPYRYGGNTPEGGFDCSGLVQYVFSGIADRGLPRSTRQWAEGSTPLDLSRLQRGDLLFFNTSGTPFSHMGIHIGNHQFVHAPSTGGTVRTDSLYNRYFAPRFDGARSVFRRA